MARHAEVEWQITVHIHLEEVDEIKGESFDYRKREEQVDLLRREAIGEIWTERGFEGIRELLAAGGVADTIGHYMAPYVAGVKRRADFVRYCLSLGGDLRSRAEVCLQGFLFAIEDDARSEVLRAAAEGLLAEECKRLFSCAPFRAATWRLLDDYPADVRDGYWKEVSPTWGRHTPAELSELIDCLLEAQRPRAAFQAVHMDLRAIETSYLKRLLRDLGTVNAEPAGQFGPDSYDISEALELLNGRTEVTHDEMAQLEFLFISALDDSEHGIPNLERLVAQSPALFVQAIALVYRRSGDGEDPTEWRIESPEQRVAVAEAAYRLLDQITKIPGTDANGRIDAPTLIGWLREVRRLCREYARGEIGDYCIGQLLAKAPGGENGLWPCEAVCEAMEAVASPEVGRGFSIGVYNSRGVHWRGEGGAQERELATKYRTWAERLHFDYPFVGRALEDLAESYQRDATREDSEADVRKRLGY